MPDPAIVIAWNDLLEVFERHLDSEGTADFDGLSREMLSFLRHPDFPQLTDDTQKDVLEAISSTSAIFLARYDETRDVADLHRVIPILSELLRLVRARRLDPLLYLMRLGFALWQRYTTAGDRVDLDQSTETYAEALAIVKKDTPERVPLLFQLALCSHGRYLHSQSLDDLKQAWAYGAEGISETPLEAPVRRQVLGHLATWLAEWTLKVEDLTEVGGYWKATMDLSPFRSEEQVFTRKLMNSATSEWLEARSPPQTPSFVELSRQRTGMNSEAQVRAWQSRIIPECRLKPVKTYSELCSKIEALQAKFAGASFVFRGQIDYHKGVLTPSLLRTKNDVELEDHLRWMFAISSIFRDDAPDPLTKGMTDLKDLFAREGGESDRTGKPTSPAIPGGLDLLGVASQAILQHYGGRSTFIDVTRCLDVALWFAHHRHMMVLRPMSMEDFETSKLHWDSKDPMPDYNIAWYEPNWDGARFGYLFVIAPVMQTTAATLKHGEFIDLSLHPATRMSEQEAGLIYVDRNNPTKPIGIVAAFKLCVPLEGSPNRVIDPRATRLFPPPEVDKVYAKILWHIPFCTTIQEPKRAVRRMQIPEYYDNAKVPVETGWSWGGFRVRDFYLRPGQVFTHLTEVEGPGVTGAEFGGKQFQLKDAQPVFLGFPSGAIITEISEPQPVLTLRGRTQLFLEYDPLALCLPDRESFVSQHIDWAGGIPEWNVKVVPFPGVRGAWVIQDNDLFWCRVYAQIPDLGEWKATTGRVFRFKHGVGFVLADGTTPDVSTMAIEHRAERAALMHCLGMVQQIRDNVWRLPVDVPKSAYWLAHPPPEVVAVSDFRSWMRVAPQNTLPPRGSGKPATTF